MIFLDSSDLSKDLSKLDNKSKNEIIKLLNNVCEEITKKTGVAGGIYLSKMGQLEDELESFEPLIRKNNNLELEIKLSSTLDQFINILKDLKEEQNQ